MKYINDYLDYLEVIKKHSMYTISNYRNDLMIRCADKWLVKEFKDLFRK